MIMDPLIEEKHFEITNLVIIESLKDTDEKTGKALSDNLKQKYGKLFEIDYYEVSSKSDLYNLFEILIDKAGNSYRPAIHLEIHGDQSNLGLISKTGEFISWFYIYYYCKELNFKTNNNLFLTLAVCRGAHLMGAIKPYDKCPWAFILGSFKNLWEDLILTDFTTFYETLINTKNVNIAFRELTNINENAKYEIIDSMMTFDRCNNYFIKEIELEITTQKKGYMLLEAIEKTSTFEKAKLKLNIDYNANIITKKDLIKYFSKNYLFATRSMVDDFRRFFCFWE